MASADITTDVSSYEENQAYVQNLLDEKINNTHNTALRNFTEFLRDQYSYKTATKVDKTNIIDQDSKQTWALPNEVVMQLLHHIEECRKSGATLHMSEKQQYTNKMESGIMLDIDAKYKIANPEIKKTSKFKLVEAIVEIIVNSLDHSYVAVEDDKSSTICGIIERPKSSLIDNEKLFKKGLHILIPGIWVTRPYKKYIVAEIKKSPKVIGILQEMGMVNADVAVDTGSATVPVYFLGSCKTSGGLKYELTSIYDVTLTPSFIRTQEIPIPTKYNLAYEFSLGFEAKYKDGMLPMIKKRIYPPSQSLESKIRDYYSRTTNGIINESDILDVDNKINALIQSCPDALYVQGLLSTLTQDYYTDYAKWRDVIFALANSSDGRINYKPLAIWFSQKCPEKFSADSVNNIWEESRIRTTTSGFKGVTIRSLEYWARQCDQLQYFEKTRQNYYHKLLNYSYEFKGHIEHAMISDLLFSMLKTKFVVDYDLKSIVWYEFITNQDHNFIEGEIWKYRREPGNPITLQQYITNKLPEVFNQVVHRFHDNRNKTEKKELSKTYATILKALEKSKLNLFNQRFKDACIKESINWFVQRGFTKKLDVSCPNVLGVGNGLLEMNKCVRFIDHYHEYFISKHTTVPWRGKFDPNKPDAFQQKLLDTISDIIIENDARIKLLMFLSTGLVGGAKNLPLLLLTGGGSNGKTLLMTLMMNTLGKDVYSSPINPLVYSKQPESPDRPNSALMQFKGRNFTVGEETNKGTPLCPAALKATNKSSDVSAREMFGKQESFQVSATQVVTSQYEFEIHTTDHGTWRRILSYVARTKFCSNPDPANIFETKDDPKCRDMATDKNYQMAWLQILVYFYEWFQDAYDGNFDLVPSPTIDLQTETFRDTQDRVNSFINKFVVYSPKYATEGQEASLESVALRFLKWHDMHYGAKRQTLSEIVKDFENSAIQKNLRRNKIGVYETFGIRVLDEKEYMRDEETYFKPRNDGYRPHKDKIPFWWKRATTETAPSPKMESKEVKEAINLVSEKSIIAQEYGNDNDFAAPKKPVEEVPKDDGKSVLDELFD